MRRPDSIGLWTIDVVDDTTALFVAKPFSGQTLSAAVRHLLDRQAA